MLKTATSTTDLASGENIPVAPDFLGGIRRASVILDEEVGELTERFDIDADWRFKRFADGVGVELRFAVRRPRSVAVGPFVAADAVFCNDDRIRFSLRPWVSKLANVRSD